ncbi:MAG: HD domain-containing protein [Clostridiaceae bacterium]
MSNTVSKVMEEMITYFDGDARRINHALKVYGFSKTIGELENLDKENQLILEIASILHDIGIKNSEIKYNSSAGNYQEIEGPPVAKDMLLKYDLSEEVIDRICFLIGNHHSYNNIDKVDFQILVEADFLVNIFEDEIKSEQVRIVKEKYFKTEAGKRLVESLYK